MSTFFKKTLKQYLFLLIAVFFSSQINAQEAKIDTIPFSLDKKFIVFKGKINGQEIDFAFDTGAHSGVANSKNVAKAQIKTLGKGTKITDSNQVKKKIGDTEIQDFEIAGFHFAKIKDHTIDMPYLYCADLYLLGQTVIKKLNWQFDFEKMLVYISKSPFIQDTHWVSWQIKNYKSNRPHIDFEVGGKLYKNLLIDTGFTSVFELDTSYSAVLKEYAEKQNQGKTREMITSSMGLTGLGKPVLVKEFKIDNVYIGNVPFKDIPISINPNTDSKIGLKFFSDLCNTLTFNFSTNDILLALKPVSKVQREILDARVTMKEEKFRIAAKTLGEKSSATNLEMDEEIVSLNGKKPTDFADECEFLLWMYLYKEESLVIEKMNGQKVVLKKWFLE